MPVKKKIRNSSSGKGDAGIDTRNLFLNVIIFILGALILYMSYAIIDKLVSRNPKNEAEVNKTEPAKIIQVEVLNGCGVKGLGDRFTDFLRDNKVDVVNVSNHPSQDFEKTLVIDRTGNIYNARKIAKLLGVKEENIVQQINNDYFLDVTLVIGRDYNQLKPLN